MTNSEYNTLFDNIKKELFDKNIEISKLKFEISLDIVTDNKTVCRKTESPEDFLKFLKFFRIDERETEKSIRQSAKELGYLIGDSIYIVLSEKVSSASASF